MRTERLQVRLSEEEMQLLRQAADLSHLNVSEFARFALHVTSKSVLAYTEQDAVEMVAKASFVAFGRTVKRSDVEGLEPIKDDDTG